MTHNEMAFILRNNNLCAQAVVNSNISISPHVDKKARDKSIKQLKKLNKDIEKLNMEIIEYYKVTNEVSSRDNQN